jgi:hypothetical protein
MTREIGKPVDLTLDESAALSARYFIAKCDVENSGAILGRCHAT